MLHTSRQNLSVTQTKLIGIFKSSFQGTTWNLYTLNSVSVPLL